MKQRTISRGSVGFYALVTIVCLSYAASNFLGQRIGSSLGRIGGAINVQGGGEERGKAGASGAVERSTEGGRLSCGC